MGSSITALPMGSIPPLLRASREALLRVNIPALPMGSIPALLRASIPALLRASRGASLPSTPWRRPSSFRCLLPGSVRHEVLRQCQRFSDPVYRPDHGQQPSLIQGGGAIRAV